MSCWRIPSTLCSVSVADDIRNWSFGLRIWIRSYYWKKEFSTSGACLWCMLLSTFCLFVILPYNFRNHRPWKFIFRRPTRLHLLRLGSRHPCTGRVHNMGCREHKFLSSKNVFKKFYPYKFWISFYLFFWSGYWCWRLWTRLFTRKVDWQTEIIFTTD